MGKTKESTDPATGKPVRRYDVPLDVRAAASLEERKPKAPAEVGEAGG